jgi:hypothetical protein
MIVEYRYNSKNVLKIIYKSRGFYIMCIISLLLAFYILKDINSIMILFVFFSIPLFLQIFIHLDYYFKDKNSILTIDYKNKRIELKNKSNFNCIFFENIDEIIYCKGSKFEQVFFKYAIPSNFYNYTIIKSKKNEKIIFSDFILKDFNLFPIKKKIIIYPFLNTI